MSITSNNVDCFSAPLASVYLDKSHDPNAKLEEDKNKIIDKLGPYKWAFLGWLKTKNIAGVISLKLETLELLVDCWLTAKNTIDNS